MTKTKNPKKRPSHSPTPESVGAPEARPLPPVRGGIHTIELDSIDPAPRNRELGDLSELVESVAKLGVLQPVLLRPKPGDDARWEVVAGHRRVAAARAAGLEVLPALVRDLDDREALEVRLIENLQRQDMHPLDESEGYQELVERHGYTAEALAARLHKSPAYVLGRLRFASLSAELHGPFRANELDVGQALLVARVSGADRQKKAWRLLVDERLPYREAAELVRREFMLELSAARFDPHAAGLVPAAGACSLCPKRAGNMPGLFEDLGGEDVCTDAACYRRKTDAAYELAAKEHKAAGGEVLAKGKASAMFHGSELSWSERDKWVHVDQPHADFGRKPVRSVLGEHLPKVILAKDEDGGAHLLVERKAALAAAKKAKLDVPALERRAAARASRVDSGDAAAAKKEDLEKAVRARLGEELVRAALEKAAPLLEKASDSGVFAWNVLRAVALARPEPDLQDFLEARGVSLDLGQARKGAPKRAKPGAVSDAVQFALSGMEAPARCSAVLGLVLGAGYNPWRGEAEEPLTSVLGALGVDPAAIEARLRTEIKADAKAKARGAKSKR